MWAFCQLASGYRSYLSRPAWFLRLAGTDRQENHGLYGVGESYRLGLPDARPTRPQTKWPVGGLASMGDLGDNQPTDEG